MKKQTKDVFPTYGHSDLFEGSINDVIMNDIIYTGSKINDDYKEWLVISILKPADKHTVRLRVESSGGTENILTFGKEVIL